MAKGTEEDRGDLRSPLLPEILHLIHHKLPDTSDFIRFRAVCTAWLNTAPVSNPPPQLPWLLQHCPASSSYHLLRPKISFYSHSSGRMYNLRVAGCRSWILGSGMGQGYTIAIVDLSRTMLYNPITSKARALPHAPFMPWKDGAFNVLNDSEAGCVVVMNTCKKMRYFAFCFCRPGVKAEWKVFDRYDNLGNTTYHDKRFYGNTFCKSTLAINPATLSIEAVVPGPPEENFYSTRGDYLVGLRGKLFRAIKHPCSETQAALETDFYFNVYQLDVVHASDGKAVWTKVDSIGDVVLFFDDHDHGISLEPNDATRLRKDCIYFMHEKKTWLHTIWENRFLRRYNMEDHRIDNTVPLGNTFADTWIVPSLCQSD